MVYRLCLEERKYSFGIYPGRNRALHLGIDDAFGRDEGEKGMRMVTPLEPPKRPHRR